MIKKYIFVQRYCVLDDDHPPILRRKALPWLARWRRTQYPRLEITPGSGICPAVERIWLVSFMDDDLGYFDDETCRLEPIANPFGPKVLPRNKP
jgi:hypothetical protein